MFLHAGKEVIVVFFYFSTITRRFAVTVVVATTAKACDPRQDCSELCRFELNHSKQEYILVGDYNIDLHKRHSNSRISNYLSAIHAVSCSSIINKHTRITETSTTLESLKFHSMIVNLKL